MRIYNLLLFSTPHWHYTYTYWVFENGRDDSLLELSERRRLAKGLRGA
jgi:hypothetical protein